ncbi:phenylalanine--tRNA ligase subunit beta, partial [Streptococcus iniae]
DEKTSHQDILDSINSLSIKHLIAIKLFDVYAGDKIEEGKKSMAYNLTFQNPNDSLRDEEVAKYMEKITKVLEEKLGAQIR